MKGMARSLTFILTAFLSGMFSNPTIYQWWVFGAVGLIIGITASLGWED